MDSPGKGLPVLFQRKQAFLVGGAGGGVMIFLLVRTRRKIITLYILKAARSHLPPAHLVPSPLLFPHSLLVPLAPWARPSERR